MNIKPPKAPTKSLVHAAEDAVDQLSAPAPAKVGPDPAASHAHAVAPAAHSPAESPLPVSTRPFVDHAALEKALEKAGVGLPPGTAAALVHVAEAKLAGRALGSLTTAELGELEDALRTEMVKTSPGVRKRQRDLREEHKNRPRRLVSADHRESATTALGGTWIFWHTRPTKTKAAVIVGESFVPTEPGTQVPAKRPDPAKAGLTGNVTWASRTGPPTTTPPPLPTKPATVPSGLSPDALKKAPQLVFDELNRARLAALEEAARVLKPIELETTVGVRRTGSRISSVKEYAPEVAGGDWDELIEVEGVTGPEVGRAGNEAMGEALPMGGDVDPELAGMARCHVFGPVFGDETLIGLAYAPHEAFNLFQLHTAEGFARWNAKASGSLNVKAGTPVKVSQYVKRRPVGGGPKKPFVRAVKYDFTLEDGSKVSAVLDIPPSMYDIPPTGKVDFYIVPY